MPATPASAGTRRLSAGRTWSATATSTTVPASQQPRRVVPQGYKVEAEQLKGDKVVVSDAQATNGSAAMLRSGSLTTAWAPSAPGMYRMSARVRSAGERVGQFANGSQIGSAAVAGPWQVVTAPGGVSGSPTWDA